MNKQRNKQDKKKKTVHLALHFPNRILENVMKWARNVASHSPKETKYLKRLESAEIKPPHYNITIAGKQRHREEKLL